MFRGLANPLDDMRIKLSFVLLAIFLAVATACAEQPVFFFTPYSAKPVAASTLKIYPLSQDVLEGEGMSAIQLDLNADGKKEFIRVYGR